MFLAELKQPVSRLKGIGPKAVSDLAKLNIFSIGDLLTHYPAKYEDRLSQKPLAEGYTTGWVNTVVIVKEFDAIPWKGKRALKIIVDEGGSRASLLCFGRNFLREMFPIDSKIFLCGNFTFRFNELQSSSFEAELYSEEPNEFDKILPCYPLSGTLNQKILRKSIRQAINDWCLNLDNELPEPIMKQKSIPEKSKLIRMIHYPASIKEVKIAESSIIYEELYHLQLTIGIKAAENRKITRETKLLSGKLADKLIKKLPFLLTKDQLFTLSEIKKDLESSYSMNRLVQGEVGSGKTLIAFISALYQIEAGKQVAMMAPTELLARQHADSAALLLSDLGVKLAYLTGQINSENRRQLLEDLKNGKIDMIVGTHALFTESVEYKDLALVIVDEQHRFGVKQRQALAEKGSNPDVLYMTATPIPRTLAISAFGEMDISTIKTMPAGRKKIETHLAKQSNSQKVYNFVLSEIEKGHQAYFVYPLIEQSDKLALKDAEGMFKVLSENVFPNQRLSMIHSKLDEDLKKQNMEKFATGEIDILVATSVVEVGVDIQNATVMVVEHAERFGLSALHQLRGRVGRGDSQSHSFLIYSDPLTEDAKERMLCMKNFSDGFTIAEKDLEIRGPGEVIGVRQSGFLKLKKASLTEDIEVMIEARKEILSLLENDSALLKSENEILRRLLEKAPPFRSDFVTVS